MCGGQTHAPTQGLPGNQGTWPRGQGCSSADLTPGGDLSGPRGRERQGRCQDSVQPLALKREAGPQGLEKARTRNAAPGTEPGSLGRSDLPAGESETEWKSLVLMSSSIPTPSHPGFQAHTVISTEMPCIPDLWHPKGRPAVGRLGVGDPRQPPSEARGERSPPIPGNDIYGAPAGLALGSSRIRWPDVQLWAGQPRFCLKRDVWPPYSRR